jgi:hypothetical protein
MERGPSMPKLSLDIAIAECEAALLVLWQPLINILGETRCGDFMYMGRTPEGIALFKRRGTRRYINIGPGGQTFRYTNAGYIPICIGEAITELFN